MKFHLTILPQAKEDVRRNAEFPYEIRDNLLGLGSRPSYRAVFTIKDDTIFVLTVRRTAQDVLRPSDVESPPSA